MTKSAATTDAPDKPPADRPQPSGAVGSKLVLLLTFAAVCGLYWLAVGGVLGWLDARRTAAAKVDGDQTSLKVSLFANSVSFRFEIVGVTDGARWWDVQGQPLGSGDVERLGLGDASAFNAREFAGSKPSPNTEVRQFAIRVQADDDRPIRDLLGPVRYHHAVAQDEPRMNVPTQTSIVRRDADDRGNEQLLYLRLEVTPPSPKAPREIDLPLVFSGGNWETNNSSIFGGLKTDGSVGYSAGYRSGNHSLERLDDGPDGSRRVLLISEQHFSARSPDPEFRVVHQVEGDDATIRLPDRTETRQHRSTRVQIARFDLPTQTPQVEDQVFRTQQRRFVRLLFEEAAFDPLPQSMGKMPEE